MIGERIKELREQRGLTQGELAALIGNDGNTISRWERNKIGIGNKYITKLAQVLDVPVTYLMGVDDDETTFMSNTSAYAFEKEAPNILPRTKAGSGGVLSYTFKNGEKLEVPDTPDTAPQFWARVDKLIGLQPTVV